MTKINSASDLQKLFTPPEKTPAQVPFGNPPSMPTFDEAKIVVYGVPFDDTATFGKGAERGPEALRHTSARQIETYVIDEKCDIYEKHAIFDLGDLRLMTKLTDAERTLLQEHPSEKKMAPVLKKLSGIMKELEVIEGINRFIMSKGKIPLMIGGEHTLSYWPLRAAAADGKKPIVIHFDAHADAKETYMDMDLCHTTPMFHFLKDAKVDFVQIGIRQADKQEIDFAREHKIRIFTPAAIYRDFGLVKKWLAEKTKGRNVYITFDIDVLDACYTPCTGTPEPFGLKPEEIVELFKAIHPTARLIGADIMEVSVKNNDFREGTIATQLLLRLFARDYVR